MQHETRAEEKDLLTEIQQKLLQMMKELDGLCREHGIHYTLGGGTAIGAIRHRGFIPWDDDIDLYMTRDNWDRLRAVWESGGFPENRVLEAPELDIHYTNTIGRYVTTDSSSVHSHQIIYDDPAGHVLDIFIFDPLDYRNYRRYLEDLMLLSDLMDETKGYSSRLDMNLRRYPEAFRRCEAGGKTGVISALVHSMTHMARSSEGGSDTGSGHSAGASVSGKWASASWYIMEWGIAPFLFPASIFDGGYIRVPFEDMTVEVVRNYSEYLTWQYGDDWQYIPPHEGREGHDAIFSNKIPYRTVRDDYLPYINVKRVRAAYIRRKKRLLKANPHRRAAENAHLEAAAAVAAAALSAKLADKGYDRTKVESLITDGRFRDLAEVFDEYLGLQLGAEFAGRRDKHSTLRRYMHPVRIPAEPWEVLAGARILIHTDRMNKAARLIDIYTGEFPENLSGTGTHGSRPGGFEADSVNSAAEAAGVDAAVYDGFRRLRAEIAAARELINAYSVISTGSGEGEITGLNEYDELYAEVCRFTCEHPLNTYILRLKLRMMLEMRSRVMSEERTGGHLTRVPTDRGIRDILSRLEGLCPEGTAAHGEILKYKADYEGASDDEYLGILTITDNGCVQMEIADRLRAGGVSGDAIYRALAGGENGGVQNAAPAAINRRAGKGLYGIARGIYRQIAGNDDRLKDRAWEIACRTRDRVTLLEMYEDRMDVLERMAESGDWEQLAEEMAPHEEAILRNLAAGLGLSVHPRLQELQYGIFRRTGRADLADKVDALVPEGHRSPIGLHNTRQMSPASKGTYLIP